MGGPNTIAVVYSKNVGGMNLLNHNGLDVRTQEEVDEAYRIVCAQAEQWHLKKISKPHLQHGTYSFYFWDCDDNCWEILTNPEGGYSWLFEQGDQPGKGHLDRNFKRPGVVTGSCCNRRNPQPAGACPRMRGPISLPNRGLGVGDGSQRVPLRPEPGTSGL